MNTKIILLAIIVIIAFVQSTTASQVTISTENKTVSYGKSFDIDISIDSQSNMVSGLQTNIVFDSTKLRVNSIYEGNFLKLSGRSTYFVNGTVDNTKGTSSPVFGVVLGMGGNVSTIGVFATLNVTAIGSGSSSIRLTNVVISDPDSNSINYTVNNGVVKVRPKCDIDGDGVVDINDLKALEPHMGETNSSYDLTGDGVVDIRDFVAIAMNFS